jgi:hypothetical protein
MHAPPPLLLFVASGQAVLSKALPVKGPRGGWPYLVAELTFRLH